MGAMDGPAAMPSNIDAGSLGKTMLEAAHAARIGVTITLVDERPHNVYVSEAAAKILGWSVPELLARDPFSNIAPEDQVRMRERANRRINGEQGQSSYELVVLRKDGARASIEVTATDVAIDGRRAVFAFLVDVTARKAAEETRLRNEARFRELIECAPEPIGISQGGHFAYANRAFVTTLGFPDAQSLYATPVHALLDSEHAAICAARSAVTLAGGPPQPPQVYQVRQRNGSIVLLEMTSVYFEYEGKPSLLIMARDMTARRRLETQLIQADRLAALGTLAAGAAHEINNPLAYTMLNLEWVARKLPDSAKDPSIIHGLSAMLDEARHGAQRVSTIVRELRGFSRADGETRRAVDLAAVVESAIKVTGHEIRHRARVTTSFEPTRPVWANEARLEQVVINLLLNAVQAVREARMESNEIRISIREDADLRAVLEITDNGQGIPTDVQTRIFDPFFTTKPVGIGTGLGLSICHGIVTSLGGHIAVYSEPGEGATFRVVLPTTDRRDEPAKAMGQPQLDAETQPSARILVVDDEPAIANTMCELLGDTHDVVVAIGAREALKVVRSGREFDVVFCDLMMPGMSGMDLFELIRIQFPALAPKCVFMTGGAFTARAREFLASVDNRQIEKPFSAGLLETIIHEIMADSVPSSPRR